MLGNLRRGAVRRLATTVLVVLACAAGAAYATTQLSSSGTATSVIVACANNENGNLRLVSGPGDCRNSEHALQWNVTGPQGAAGQQGPQGLQGPQGVAGLNGQSVTSALLAANDPNCLFGGARFTSITGQTYACNGTPGRDGTNGTDGENGTNGMNGTDGRDGNDGRDGTNGTGVTGAALAVGDANCPFGGSKFTSAAGDTYACNGAPGKDGTDGQNGRDGAGGGLTSFDAVSGLPCTRDGQTGTIAVSYASDGTATLKCNVSVNVLTDPHNCGAVGHDVSGTYANATTLCVNGAPQFGACADGFADWNGDLSDGCELAITPDALEPDDSVAQAANYPAGSPIETISPAGEVDVYNMGPHVSCHTTTSEFIISTDCGYTAPTVHSAPAVQVTFLDTNGNPVSGSCGTVEGENSKTGDFSSSTCTAATIDNMRYIKITSAAAAAYTIN